MPGKCKEVPGIRQNGWLLRPWGYGHKWDVLRSLFGNV